MSVSRPLLSYRRTWPTSPWTSRPPASPSSTTGPSWWRSSSPGSATTRCSWTRGSTAWTNPELSWTTRCCRWEGDIFRCNRDHLKHHSVAVWRPFKQQMVLAGIHWNDGEAEELYNQVNNQPEFLESLKKHSFFHSFKKHFTLVFLLRDRVNFASLVTVILMSKMEYCTDILRFLKSWSWWEKTWGAFYVESLTNLDL